MGRNWRFQTLPIFTIARPNMYRVRPNVVPYQSTIQLGTQMGTRPRKVPTASTFFSVVATCFPGVPGKLRADLGSSHDSKTFGLFSLARSHQNFRVLKCTTAHTPSTYNRPIQLFRGTRVARTKPSLPVVVLVARVARTNCEGQEKQRRRRGAVRDLWGLRRLESKGAAMQSQPT